MIDRLISYLAPHYCCSCGEIGAVLCDNCKYDIASEPFYGCFSCGSNVIKLENHQACKLYYEKAWSVGERGGALQRAIGVYKFQGKRSAAYDLARLLDEVLPVLPVDTIVVPIPTVASHIRERGFDHAALLARRFAKLRGLSYASPLRRRTATKQRDANRRQRLLQASEAFKATTSLSGTSPYLLIDDVTTTGATLNQAARILKESGASTVWVAALARQPLD